MGSHEGSRSAPLLPRPHRSIFSVRAESEEAKKAKKWFPTRRDLDNLKPRDYSPYGFICTMRERATTSKLLLAGKSYLGSLEPPRRDREEITSFQVRLMISTDESALFTVRFLPSPSLGEQEASNSGVSWAILTFHWIFGKHPMEDTETYLQENYSYGVMHSRKVHPEGCTECDWDPPMPPWE